MMKKTVNPAQLFLFLILRSLQSSNGTGMHDPRPWHNFVCDLGRIVGLVEKANLGRREAGHAQGNLLTRQITTHYDGY